MKFGKNKDVVYEVKGKEREELGVMFRQLVSLQAAFFGLADFIGRREGVDFSKAQFDQTKLAFIRIPESQQAQPQA